MSDRRGPDTPSTASSAARALERVTDAVLALDDEWRLTYLNEQAERLLRPAGDDPLGSVAWDVVPDAVEDTFRRECERAMATGDAVTFEVQFPRPDIWYELHAYPSETGLTVCFRDVTERVGREHALAKRERALQDAYEVIADPTLGFKEQIESLLGVVRDAIGTEYATLSRVHPDANRYIFETVDVPDGVNIDPGDSVPLSELPNCAHVVETAETLVLENVDAEAPALADPTWGISCYLGTPVTVDDEVYGTFCFYGLEARSEDFSDWEVAFVELLGKWVSAELERQRQNNRLESSASMLAHELRSPLSVGQLYARQLAEETSPDAAETAPDAAEHVTEAFDRIEELVDVMLVIARGADADVDREPVPLDDAAVEAWRDVSGSGANLQVETDRRVAADPIHLQHLLENLFENALEHGSTSPPSQAREDAVEHGSTGSRSGADDGGEHGSTGSRTEAESGDAAGGDARDLTVRVGDLPTGFYVADDGAGIPEGERGRVFEAGYTTAEDGMGVGLAFVTELADTYDWSCRVTESEAGGARFEFTGVQFADEESS